MKSSKKDLEQRGYLEEDLEIKFQDLSIKEKYKLLESDIPKERSQGARLLSQERSFVSDRLIRALKIEKKLYSKIEICKALEAHKNDSIPLLIQELGRIGSNQHVHIPDKEFKKDSYPLPRDIAARTLASIGKPALERLLLVLENGFENQVSEAIDAVGFICYYDYQPNVFEKLANCYLKYSNNELIRWKLIRAMSGIPESLAFLEEKIDSCQNKMLKSEISRSIRLIRKRNSMSLG